MKPASPLPHPAARRLLAWTLGILACTANVVPALAAKSPPALTTEAEQAFWWGDFAAIDKKNEELRHGKHIEANGGSELEYFRNGLGSVIATTVDHREPYLHELEALTLQWTADHPKSSLAHILYARVLVAHAWSYRGTGYAKDVPPEAWKDFRAYLERAAKYLQAHADVALTDSSAHVVLMEIGTGLDWDTAALEAIQHDGLKRNPNDFMLYFAMLTPLLPKWHGDPRTLDTYIRHVVEQTWADYGMGMYARLYSEAADEQFGHALFRDSLADWPTMKKAYEDMQARFPDSPARLNRYAYMACLAKDRATLALLLAQLGDKVDASLWGPNPKRSLEGCQRWAGEADAPAPSAPPAPPAPSGI